MIVIDIGCAEYGGDQSIGHLVEMYHPRIIYGFDPNPACEDTSFEVEGTLVETARKAAWTRSGRINFFEDGLNSQVAERHVSWGIVECFSLASFIASLPTNEPLVLKIDAEGAEYPLLGDLHDKGLDARLELLLIEWHPPIRPWQTELHQDKATSQQELAGRGRLEAKLVCPIEEWEW